MPRFARRKRVSKSKSKKIFRRSAGVSKFNLNPPMMRGGVRL